MKNQIICILLSFCILSCSASKKAVELSNKGNHASAIDVLIKKITEGVSNNSKNEYNTLLFNAYNKLVAQSEEKLRYLNKDNSLARFEETYNLYLTLSEKQKSIKALLPLHVNNKPLSFNFRDYSSDLIVAKNNFVNFLYEKAKSDLTSTNKTIIRKAYDDLIYLDKIQPYYKTVNELIEEARFKGQDFVYVSLENQSQIAIPKRLEDELLQFNTFGLNDKWTVYHSKKRYNLTYDYNILLNFQNILVSPERIENNRLVQEKVIVDGTEFILNDKGEQIRDVNGNLIKIDKKITIRCQIEELTQTKEATIQAKVEFWDERSKQLIQSFPLSSNFLFRDVSARVRGDRRALEDSYIPIVKNPIPFPSDEQIIYQGAENLKNQLKNILANYGR